MDQQEIINKIELILEEAKTAILATSDKGGQPYLRWMTPAILKYHPDSIFCFTVPGTEKLKHIAANNKVEWMIQTRDLREIVNVRGTVNIIETPATKSELLETLGPRLATFWKANATPDEFIILETKIQTAVYSQPMKALRQTVNFAEAQ